MKVPAVNVDISDDGSSYVVTATPWPTIDRPDPHPFVAKLRHNIYRDQYGRAVNPQWSDDARVVSFVKKLMNSYPKVSV